MFIGVKDNMSKNTLHTFELNNLQVFGDPWKSFF